MSKNQCKEPCKTGERELLAREQLELVSFLVKEKTSLPNQFDQKKLIQTKKILLKKRMKAIQKSWPEVVSKLNALQFTDFKTEFIKYSQRMSTSKYHHGLLDGRLFVRHLHRKKIVCEKEIEQVRHFDHHFGLSGKSLVRRKKLQSFLLRHFSI